MITRRWVLGVALLAVLASGCGGGDDDDGGSGGAAATPTTASADPAEAAVKEAATLLVTLETGAAVCGELVSDRFLRDWYAGDEAACVTAWDKTSDQEPGEREVGAVDVTGPDEASVEVAYVSGRLEGTRGHVAFVREGEAWKLDDYEDDYLRSNLAVSAQATAEEGGTLALANRPLRECVMARIGDWSAAELRRFAIAVESDKRESQKIFNAEAAECPRELAAYVADGIADALTEDGDNPPAYVRCMRRTLTGLLYATGLAEKAMKGGRSSMGDSAIMGLAGGAQKRCAGQR